jgi:biopolymer transport protein ExbD
MQIKAGLEPDPEVMVDINTTPLVDVLLVLLVMLIITIPIQLHAVNIEMPGASAPPPPAEPVVVRLDVTPAGQFLWNGEALADRSALEAKLREAASRAEQPEIHLRPNRLAKYDAVAAALASAQRLGLVKIGLVGSEQFAAPQEPAR